MKDMKEILGPFNNLPANRPMLSNENRNKPIRVVYRKHVSLFIEHMKYNTYIWQIVSLLRRFIILQLLVSLICTLSNLQDMECNTIPMFIYRTCMEYNTYDL